MILPIKVDLKEIHSQQREFPWSKPSCCPRCRSNRLWGHGFADSYFDGIPSAIPLRRYRCPDCHCIIKLKPKGYFTRFQASIKTIQESIIHRIKTGQYLKNLCRHRQHHWFQALIRQTTARLGNLWKEDIQKAFNFLIDMGFIPVTRSI